MTVIRRSDEGFTLIELLIVVAIIMIIVGMAMPMLGRNKMVANEASAVTTLQGINKAQTLYATSCGGGTFATSLAVLGTPSPGTTEPFLSIPELTGAGPAQKAGFTFAMTAGADSIAAANDCNGTATQTHYYASAVPVSFGSTGTKSYAMNDKGNVYQVYAAAPPTEPFGPPAEPAK